MKRLFVLIIAVLLMGCATRSENKPSQKVAEYVYHLRLINGSEVCCESIFTQSNLIECNDAFSDKGVYYSNFVWESYEYNNESCGE